MIGKALAHLPVALQTEALLAVVNRQLSTEETEALVQAMQRKTVNKEAEKPDTVPSPEIKAIEQRFEHALGTRVKLHNGNKGGRLVIYYYSDEEFQTLYERLVGGDL